VPAPVGVGATPQRAKRAGLNPRAYARLRGRIPEGGAPAPRSGAQLLRCPPWPYRHMAFVGRLASGPSWPQRITRLYM